MRTLSILCLMSAVLWIVSCDTWIPDPPSGDDDASDDDDDDDGGSGARPPSQTGPPQCKCTVAGSDATAVAARQGWIVVSLAGLALLRRRR